MSVAIDKPKKIDGFDEWEVRNAADVLRQAQEIRLKSKLFRAAQKELRRQQRATQKALDWSAKL